MASGLTTNFLIPYPLSTDPVDVAGDIEDLADRLESVITTIAPPQLNNSGKFLTTNGSVASWADPFPSQSSNSGKYLTTNGSSLSWASVDAFPSQSGNTGKYLTTNGSSVSWASIDALPSQSGNAGEYLTTDGSTASWATIPVTAAATPTVAGTVLGYTDSANGNIGLGFSALGNQSASNDEHIAIGYQALSSVGSSAFGDVMIGYRSGYGITTSEYNIGIGGFNFWGATTGSYNTAIGYEALPAYKAGGLTGSENTFIGYRAGYDSTASISNSVALGNYALYALNAAYSTAVGSTALQNSTTGGSNTAIGFEAGAKVTTGANNTIIGTSAGGGYVYSTATDLTTGSNNILIGYRVEASSASVSNEITLGNSNITRLRIPGLNIDWQNGPYTLSRNVQTVSYTIALSDSGKLIEMNLSSANTLAIPLNSTTAFAIGTQINILQTGTGQTTIAGVVGVTVNGNPGLKLAGQWAAATIIKRDTNTWVAIGNLTT